ncbi:hypothetical protein FH972_018411 [Carpinus fangiana]|uniref:Uncharacterized protein n=1 Tax=Carpinus fangiana TaxID=176857 RepID=A0A5N6RQ96_9ROSI|nr:hypothetical protein FH972_018411 [Carpinus fangiana]
MYLLNHHMDRGGVKMGLSMGEKMVAADFEPPLKPKKGGVTVIPPKRKLVKKMMFDSIASLLCLHRHPSPSDAGIISPPNKPTENVKNMKIFPHGGHQISAAISR